MSHPNHLFYQDAEPAVIGECDYSYPDGERCALPRQGHPDTARDRALDEAADILMLRLFGDKDSGVATDREDILGALRSVAEDARREEAEACAKIAENACACTCDEAYTGRGLTAPDCFKHEACDEAAAQIREAKR